MPRKGAVCAAVERKYLVLLQGDGFKLKLIKWIQKLRKGGSKFDWPYYDAVRHLVVFGVCVCAFVLF